MGFVIKNIWFDWLTNVVSNVEMSRIESDLLHDLSVLVQNPEDPVVQIQLLAVANYWIEFSSLFLSMPTYILALWDTIKTQK